jgi:hypothetical protein
VDSSHAFSSKIWIVHNVNKLSGNGYPIAISQEFSEANIPAAADMTDGGAVDKSNEIEGGRQRKKVSYKM